MIRTILSIFITLALILGVSFFEIAYVHTTFDTFSESIESLRDKVEAGIATYQDGITVQNHWRKKRDILHIWVPHNSLQEVDYQLDETVGFLYVNDYESALPKLEVVAGLTKNIPELYTFRLGNIF